MLNLFFPAVCRGCGQELLSGETEVCTHCRHELPLACFHRNGEDAMKKVFYGRTPVENATALLRFQKGNLTQKLVHALKYKGAKKLGTVFGNWLGEELARHRGFKKTDLIIPVPLHKRRLRKRGYNQVEGFGKAVAERLEIPYVDDVLVKRNRTASQVFKERLSRIFYTRGVFRAQNLKKIEKKHVLLVDDLVTTGATLEACSEQLLRAPGVRLSVATIAITV